MSGFDDAGRLQLIAEEIQVIQRRYRKLSDHLGTMDSALENAKREIQYAAVILQNRAPSRRLPLQEKV